MLIGLNKRLTLFVTVTRIDSNYSRSSALKHFIFRYGDKHPSYNGDGPVWYDRAAHLHPSGRDGPELGVSGTRHGFNNTRSQS